ncbi:MAG TPA: hypothetical protein G4N98_02855 [Thermoflexia bacterium]|nr:hypothetical protein [Thermoflexia bacterium]
MTAMIRKQIYIKPRQEELLKRIAAETGSSEAELIQQALDSWSESTTERRRALAAWGKARAFMESLAAQGPVPGGRSWTREELHDR